MPSLYESLAGQTSKQNTEVQAFANAIRQLSTSHKRVSNMREAQKLKLQWAEENHQVALANAAEKFKQEQLKRERAEYEFEQLQQSVTQQREAEQQAKEARGGAVEAFLKHRKGAEDSGIEDALVNLAEADPDFAQAYKNVLEGAIQAVDAPDDKKQKEAMERLKLLREKMEIGSVKAQQRQREAAASRTDTGEMFDIEKGVKEQKKLEAEAEAYRRERNETTRNETLDGVYREMGQFGGREQARARYKEQYKLTVDNTRTELNSLMRDIQTQLGLETGAKLSDYVESSIRSGGTVAFGQMANITGKEDIDKDTQTKIDMISTLTNRIVDAKEQYLQQVRFTDITDTITNDMFNILTRGEGYSPTEAKEDLVEAVPELLEHIQAMKANLIGKKKAGQPLPDGTYATTYEAYLHKHELPIKPIHQKLLKSAWMRFKLFDKQTFADTAGVLGVDMSKVEPEKGNKK